jgi:hypothetical protein
MTKAIPADGAPTPQAFEALAYEAPFLIEKLLKDRIVETPEEAESLFNEVKKYLVIARLDETRIWKMYSLRIDEAWHQFILFTRQYIEFCQRFFGRYIPHSPSNAPESKPAGSVEATSFKLFQDRYRELFGTPLPDVWYDERNVTTRRRVLNDRAGSLTLRDGLEMVEILSPQGEVMLSVNELARDALAFIASTGAFYVRELPGDLTDDEKIALVATLIECKILRSAP